MIKKFVGLFLMSGLLISSFSSCEDEGKDSSAPDAPTGFQFFADSSSDGQLKMIWDKNSERDLDLYRLYRKTATSSYSLLVEVDETEYTDKGLDYTTEYFYTLTAVDDAGNESEDSPEISASPLNLNAPAQPAFTGVAGSNNGAVSEIRLNWTSNSEGDLDHYELFRSTNVVFPIDQSTLLTSVSTGTLYIDRAVDVGQRYYYRVTAVDKGGIRSNISGQTDDLALPLPQPLSPINAAQVTTLLPEFKWQRVEGAVAYRISLKTSLYSGEIWTKDLDQSSASELTVSYPSSADDLEYSRTYYWSIITFSKTDGEPNSENTPVAFITPSM